jgi:hypothetical protein
MKKILRAISWTLFFIALLASITTALSTVAGIITLFLTLCSTLYLKAFAFCAVLYFISIAVLFVIYLIVCAYSAIEKAVHNK